MPLFSHAPKEQVPPSIIENTCSCRCSQLTRCTVVGSPDAATLHIGSIRRTRTRVVACGRCTRTNVARRAGHEARAKASTPRPGRCLGRGSWPTFRRQTASNYTWTRSQLLNCSFESRGRMSFSSSHLLVRYPPTSSTSSLVKNPRACRVSVWCEYEDHIAQYHRADIIKYS